MHKKKILFLYTELAGYTVACLDELNKCDVEVFLINWAVNKEAPFQFKLNAIHQSFRDEYSNDEDLIRYCKSINPDILLVSGWLDKGYLKVAKLFFKKIPTVLTMDNNWIGSLKQYMATWVSQFYLLNKFSHVWVPGSKQKEFAKKLGYSEDKIMTGFYSCNRTLFYNYYKKNKQLKTQKFPKVFLFVGRYIKSKGIFNLWNAFVEINSKHDNEWELWCVGTGEEWNNKINHPRIKHFGFVQPDKFEEIIQKSGVYVMPSEFEPWGVSLHEFVSAGYPVIVSDQVGSSEVFVKKGKNGSIINLRSKVSLKEEMNNFMKMNDKDLLLMSEESVSLSEKISPEIWVEKLISLL